MKTRLKFVLVVLFLNSQGFGSFAQGACTSMTIGDLFKTLKALDYKTDQKLSYKRYFDFDFATLKPIEGGVDSLDFFEVGFDSQNKIKEVTHRSSKYKLLNYKLIVFNYPGYNILILKQLYFDEFQFSPTAILMIKGPKFYENYLINVAAMLGTRQPYTPAKSFSFFPVKKFEDISLIMELDENLYPLRTLRLSNSQVVMSSYFHYKEEGSHLIEDEVANFYFTPRLNAKTKITNETCLRQIFFDVQTGEYLVTLHPNMREVNAPLWLFNGCHDYK